MSKSKSFDPYLDWLKIPADKRPPNYYALLGVDEFEEDLEKIEESFQELYSKVRRYQVGDHSADAVRLLTEMSRAYDCLTSPHHKKKYDRELRGGDAPAQEQTLTAPAPAKKPAQVELIDDDEPLTPTGPAAGAPTLNVLGAADPSVPTAPLSGLAPSSTTPQPAAAPAESPSSYENVWYIQTPDGRRLGPATQQQLDEVVAHRRVNPRSMIWRVGWPEAKPVVQMFPELKPAGGAGAVGPYHKLQVRPEVEQSRKAIFFVVLLLGVIALGLGLVYGFAFTTNFMLMGFVGLVGAFALAVGLMELAPLMNSPVLTIYRERIGNEPTRKLFAWVGGMCVAVSLVMISWQAFGYLRPSVRGISSNIPNVAQMPNLNGAPGSGGGGGGARTSRPARPGFMGSSGASTIPGASFGASAPRISGFSTYELAPGRQVTISGSGLSGATKVLFIRPGNAKSRSMALEAQFTQANNSLQVTVPLQMRFGREWICEVQAGGGIAVSIPPNTRTVSGPGDFAKPNSIFRLTQGAQTTAIMSSIVILEGGNKFNMMMFSRAYVLNDLNAETRNCKSNVLIGGPSMGKAPISNDAITASNGITLFQQPTAFSIR